VQDHMKILILEDDPDDLRRIERLLAEAPKLQADVTEVSTLKHAMRRLEDEDFDVVLVDLAPPDSKGEGTIDALRHICPRMPVVVITSCNDDEFASRAMRSGARDYLVKGTVDAAMLGASLRYALRRHELFDEVRRPSFVDSLTGLFNRRGVNTFGKQILRLADRYNQPALVVFSDLDHLRTINDDEGRWVGDLALVEAADVLRETFQSPDVVARIGGDEFAIITLLDRDDVAEELLGRVEARLSARNDDGFRSFDLSLNTGWAIYEAGSKETVDEIIARADRAMRSRRDGLEGARA